MYFALYKFKILNIIKANIILEKRSFQKHILKMLMLTMKNIKPLDHTKAKLYRLRIFHEYWV